jgi:hypothetical protein
MYYISLNYAAQPKPVPLNIQKIKDLPENVCPMAKSNARSELYKNFIPEPSALRTLTHSTFRGLQKTLKEKLVALPADASPELAEGLRKAHTKLSDYYYKYDQSPFYIWAARKLNLASRCSTHPLTVLDPRFNYKKLCKDYTNDPDLSEYLETQKKALCQCLDGNYPTDSSTGAAPTASTSGEPGVFGNRSGMINFAALDQGSDDEEDNDELTRYFDAPRAPSHSDPVDWWFARKWEFPRLYRFARDIMSIPGKFRAATQQPSLL